MLLVARFVNEIPEAFLSSAAPFASSSLSYKLLIWQNSASCYSNSWPALKRTHLVHQKSATRLRRIMIDSVDRQWRNANHISDLPTIIRQWSRALIDFRIAWGWVTCTESCMTERTAMLGLKQESWAYVRDYLHARYRPIIASRAQVELPQLKLLLTPTSGIWEN